MAQGVGAMHPLGRPITAEDCAEAAVYLVSDRRQERHRCAPARRRRVRGAMSVTPGGAQVLDRDELRRLFDLRSSYNAFSGGGYTDDPYPVVARAPRAGPGPRRASSTSSPATRATGSSRACRTQIDRTSPRSRSRRATRRSATATCSRPRRPRSSIDTDRAGRVQQHPGDGRCAAPSLPRAGAAVVRAGQGPVVDQQLDRPHRALAHRRVRRRRARGAQRRLRRRHPRAHHHRELRGERRTGARDPRVPHERLPAGLRHPGADRRGHGAIEPTDDLISVLVEAEYTDEDGVVHRLSDAEIYSFAMLLLAAGSGTTWKQMGITLAAILERPDVLAAVRDDRHAGPRRRSRSRSGGRRPIPMFSRHVTRDTEFFGARPPARVGACTSASVRPTATRRAGIVPTSTTSGDRRSRRWPSGTDRTSASGCTSPERR